jgi:hypothetical protein
MNSREIQLENAVIEFYREEIRRRYLLDNVRRFQAFDPVPDELIALLRGFFMDSIYPPVELRRQYDDAFAHLSGILHSPRRLKPLIGTALASAWRLGPRLPAAISAGVTTVDSLMKTRQLEAQMLTAAKAMDLSEAEMARRDVMIRIIAAVPEKAVLDLIDDALSYFQAMTNIRMLDAMLDIMERCHGVMTGHPAVYSEEECAGVALGVALVREGIERFRTIDKKLFPAILQGIEETEHDWYDRIRAEAENG